MASVPDPNRAIANGVKLAAVPLAAQQPTRLQARIDTAYSTDWTPEEQVALDATLDKYPAARHSALERYLRAAAALPKKTARDVALRVKWLATSAHASKRRLADDGAAKKRPRVQSIFAVQPKGAPPLGIPAPGVPAPGVPVAPLQQSILSGEDAVGVSTVGGGSPMAQLLEQNYHILNQYKQNMQQYKVHENTELLVRFRDNIMTIQEQMRSIPGLMQRMPPIPAKLNTALASMFLPKPGGGMYAARGQPVFQSSQSLPASVGFPVAPAPAFQQAAGAGAVIPVSGSSPQQTKSSSKSPDTRQSSGRSKSKSGASKRGTSSVKTEEKSGKLKSELRTSARRAAQKPQTAKPSDVRTSARLAAASDSAQS